LRGSSPRWPRERSNGGKAITDQGYSAPNVTDDNPEKEVAPGYVPDGYESQAEFLKYARDLYSDDIEYDKENRDMALDDLKFIAGEQWDPDVKAARKGRPIITINTLPQFVGQVIGDRRLNKTTIKVIATKDASAEMAQTRSGIIKSIEATSRAERAYDMALRGPSVVRRWQFAREYGLCRRRCLRAGHFYRPHSQSSGRRVGPHVRRPHRTRRWPLLCSGQHP
jgi:hypothetical protein